MNWQYLNEMFPNGQISIDESFYTIDEIKESNLPFIIQYVHKPIRETYENMYKYTYYKDNSLDVEQIYNVFPNYSLVNGIPLFNAYGQMVMNKINGEING